jgi:hypothetical protein
MTLLLPALRSLARSLAVVVLQASPRREDKAD